jgi:hypothetical protein
MRCTGLAEMNKFFTLHQNNSGGRWEAPAAYIYIEADTREEAVELTSRHITICQDSGLYADYDNCGCCPCCGHRWSLYSNEPTNKGEVHFSYFGKIKNFLKYLGTTNAALIKADGSLLVGDTMENFTAISDYVGFKND